MVEGLHWRYSEGAYSRKGVKAHLLKCQFTEILHSNVTQFFSGLHNSRSNAHHFQENIKNLRFKRDYVNFPGIIVSIWCHVVWFQSQMLHQASGSVTHWIWTTPTISWERSVLGSKELKTAVDGAWSLPLQGKQCARSVTCYSASEDTKDHIIAMFQTKNPRLCRVQQLSPDEAGSRQARGLRPEPICLTAEPTAEVKGPRVCG